MSYFRIMGHRRHGIGFISEPYLLVLRMKLKLGVLTQALWSLMTLQRSFMGQSAQG